MLPTLLVLLVVLIGHGLLLIVAVNASHGLGFHTRWAETLTLVFLGVFGLASVGFAAWVLLGHPWADWPSPLQAYGLACALVALAGFPLVTLLRVLRRSPEGLSGHDRQANPHRDDVSEGRSRLHRLPGNQSLDLLVRDWRIPVRGLPQSLDGLSIVHLTDWHMSPRYDRRFFEHAVDEANRFEPDLVLFSGDLVEDESSVAWIEPILGRLSARVAKVAILGNHDLLYGPRAIEKAIEDAGFLYVDGRWTALEARGRAIAFGGTSAPWGPTLDPSERPDADLSIVLSHSPDRFYRIASWDAVDLVLAGHNHGGQVRLPIVGPILMPSVYSRRFDRGFFRKGRTWMYVSQGLGGKHPIRYNCPPEITRLVLQAEPPSGTASHRPVRRSVELKV